MTRHRREQLGAYRDGPGPVVGPGCCPLDLDVETLRQPDNEIDDEVDETGTADELPTGFTRVVGESLEVGNASGASDCPASTRIVSGLRYRTHQPVKILSLDRGLSRAEPVRGQGNGCDVVTECSFVHSDVFRVTAISDPTRRSLARAVIMTCRRRAIAEQFGRNREIRECP